MKQASKRVYHSDLRAEQARRTRKQIVDAAGALFAQRGFASTTIDAIAAAAKVSRKTVFTSVPGGKVELLRLARDFTLAGDDEPVALQDRPQIQALIADPDPHHRMAQYAALVVEIGTRLAPLWRALRGAAEIDPEARALYEQTELTRRQAMRTGPVAMFLAEGSLRPDLTADEAADIIAVLNDPTLYQRFVVECGWTRERFGEWLADSMQTVLISPEAWAGRSVS